MEIIIVTPTPEVAMTIRRTDMHMQMDSLEMMVLQRSPQDSAGSSAGLLLQMATIDGSMVRYVK